LEPLLPKRPRTDRPNRSHRPILNSVLWILRTGAPWRGQPERYGPVRTVSSRFYRWCAAVASPVLIDGCVQHHVQTILSRVTLAFTQKHASWLNLVEGFFSKIARSVLRHIRVASKQELKHRTWPQSTISTTILSSTLRPTNSMKRRDMMGSIFGSSVPSSDMAAN
jgi:transposase